MSGLPDYVQFCGSCAGAGQYEQMYTAGCGAGYFRMTGRCDYCDGTGLRFSDASGRTGVPPESVRLQCEPALADARATLDDYGPAKPPPGIWIGVSVENQEWADKRREDTQHIPAVVRFASYEPALGPVDWTGWEFLNWMISGGESGLRARFSHPHWHRAARDFCSSIGIPYLFKQWGEWRHAPDRAHFKELIREAWVRAESGVPGVRPALMVREGKKVAGRLLDGVQHDGVPA